MPEAAWLIVVWLIVVGAAVGSFLNVVVYRLPLGISLVHPPSHCPKCGKRIPWYDNVPVLGWIMLRGRCRQCHNPISARYPVVEAITAAMFGAVAVAEITRFDFSEFCMVYPCHMLLLCTLLCVGLIEYDGNRVPWKLLVPALVVGAFAPCPALWPMPAWRLLTLPVLTALWFSFVLLGCVVSVMLLGLRNHEQAGLGLSLVCVGLFIGWGTLGTIVLATAICGILVWIVGHVWPKAYFPRSMFVGMLALAWILIWARLVSP